MATQQPDAESGGSVAGKQLVLLALISIAGVLLYKVLFSDGFTLFQNPKEVRLTYVPADFQPNMDEEKTLRILSEPEKYKKEFDELVYNFNMSLLYHVANRMALPDSLKRRLEPEYKKHHEYLKTLYYNDFVALKDTTAGLYETWYNDNSNEAVRVFNEVAGKYTCFFITQIMATLLKADSKRVMAKGTDVGTPCDVAIHEGLQPMITRLQKRAEIYDFSNSRGLLKDKVRKNIAELATYEFRSRMGIDKTLQYKVLGFSVSETDIRVEAISIIKAGFKLDQFFDITFSPTKGIIYVKLPQPTILSHEVYPRVDKLDVGWLAGVSEADMNERFNELRRELRRDAIENEKVLDKAKLHADSVMQLILGPVVKSINRNYKLEVRFENAPETMTEDEWRRQGQEGAPPQQPAEAPKAPRDKGKVLAN